MILKQLILLLLAIFIASLITVQSTKCNRSCGDRLVPYPFGFSSGCPIPLNCSSNAHQQLDIAGFPILNISNDRMKISIEATCNRPLRDLHRLYGPNYAPTSRNAILLQNCSVPAACMIPSTMVYTHFEALACSTNGSSNISCYSENKANGLIDYNKVIKTHCKSFLSSISTESFNESGVLEVQVVELRWWIEGRCSDLCSENALCDEIISPFNRLPGSHCRCRNGFIGDGFRAGDGCRKGIAAGTSLMICTVLICCFLRRQWNSKTIRSTKSLLSEASNISIPIHTYKEIEKATNGFSEKQRLGTGAFGTVYAGKLHNNSWVAIKRIKHRDADCIGQVHLQRERGDGLAWPVRLTIAAETAQAIAHLHSAIDPPIYHRDIKSSNILLDYNFRSKVADFGLSRLGETEISHISTAPQGTPGYLDPQYHQNFHLSDKSDVYSFGVVLIEIITALKVVDFSRPPNEANLASVATDRISKGRLDEIIDPFLDPNSDSWTLSSIHKVAELAFRCLSFHRDMRPTMMELAIELEQIKLSRWVPGEEITCEASSEVSPCSSSSNLSEQPLSKAVSKKGGVETRGLLMLRMSNVGFMNSMERRKDHSPVSVQDPWLSEQSSPSSSSFLNNVTH
ncbi:hypothetical protein V6N13_001381 [Hibiscus sabdariffa]|uniref:Protein kinase domain-containing protein n=1 Tax=Hibiscus sabdariffa TaxID=183260 RepID=A0ABR2G904_9ROSI